MGKAKRWVEKIGKGQKCPSLSARESPESQCPMAESSGGNEHDQGATSLNKSEQVRGQGVAFRNAHCAELSRITITAELSKTTNFGSRFARSQWKKDIYNRCAQSALSQEKETDIVSKVWTVKPGDAWLNTPVNLYPRSERSSFLCKGDVYDYQYLGANALVVDFANRRVGGGCFGEGFVQEEQMVAQSADFAVRLRCHQDVMGRGSACTYQGVHIDIWWNREQAAQKNSLDINAVEDCHSQPLTIIAVDAPVMRGRGSYSKEALEMLAKKTYLVMEVGQCLAAPTILSGLLGGGAFRGNRPLILLLHLLLQPVEGSIDVQFHHPIFWSFSRFTIPQLEQRMLELADDMLLRLSAKGVSTLREALEEIFSWELVTSHDDIDIVGRYAS